MPRLRRKSKYGTGSVSRDGAFWRARWREGRRRRSRSQFPTRELAQRFLDGVIGELARGHARVVPDRSKVPGLAVLAKEWFDQRQGPANRNNEDERRKWTNHLLPELGHLRPDEVSTTQLRTLINSKLQSGRIRRRPGDPDGLSSTMVLQLIRILGSLYTYLLEEGTATTNPVRLLPKSTRRKIKPAHDWRSTPFVRRLADVKRIYAALGEPVSVAYALGVMRGPRPGEIRALSWANIDLGNRLITIDRQIRHGKLGPPKGGRSRTIPISDELHAILAAWHLRTGGAGLVIPPRRRKRGRETFIGEKALNRALDVALEQLELPAVNWYQATRHTFGSHWVLQGGSLETLALLLGHASSEVTRRYAHLRTDLLGAADLGRAQVDLAPGRVVALQSVPGDVPWAELGPDAPAEEEGETAEIAKK
jgi:integrase